MKKTIQRLFSTLCVLCVCFSFSITPVSAGDAPWASSFAYTLNDAILNYGALSTENSNGYLGVNCDTGEYPQGVIYADLMTFDNNYEQYLVTVRSESYRGGVFVDVYRYDEITQKVELLSVLSKGYNMAEDIVREISWGHNDSRRYIVFTDYRNGEKVHSEYYTVIDGAMYLSMMEPENTGLSGVVTFGRTYLHPEVDVSYFNDQLSVFFTSLKDYSAEEIEYENILDNITRDEIDDLKIVLNKTAGFSTFDISDYDTMAEYALAVKAHDREAELNAITHVYDLGDELYYVRYSTDQCFYNGAILRKTDAVLDNYQILLVKNDFIPFSQSEVEGARDTYLKSKLLLEKSEEPMETKNKPLFSFNKLQVEKKIDVPKVISGDLRLPIALIGGGVILGLFVVLFVIMGRNDDEK